MDSARRQDLARWAGAGLLSTEQVEAIDEWEAGRELRPRPRRALVAEAAGYAGVVLAASAGSLALAQYWADFETWARLLLVVTGTAFVGAGAWATSGGTEEALRRLAAFLWTATVAGVFGTAVLTADEALGLAGQNVALIAGATATAVAAALLWRRSTTLLALALLASLVVLVVGVVSQYDHVSSDAIGTAIWGLGVCWTLLVLGGVVPSPRPALAAGGVVALAGAQVMVDDWTVGRWVGLGTAVVLLAGSGGLRAPGLAVAGLPGLFVFTGELVAAATTRDGAPEGSRIGLVLGVVVVGLALLAAAVVVARQQGQEGAGDVP